jgi:hypothetical protein
VAETVAGYRGDDFVAAVQLDILVVIERAP